MPRPRLLHYRIAEGTPQAKAYVLYISNMETSDKTQAFEDSIEESGGEVRALCIKTKLSLITVSCSGDKMCEG